MGLKKKKKGTITKLSDVPDPQYKPLSEYNKYNLRREEKEVGQQGRQQDREDQGEQVGTKREESEQPDRRR